MAKKHQPARKGFVIDLAPVFQRVDNAIQQINYCFILNIFAHFTLNRTIYEKLAGAFSEEQRTMYLQRVEEITPNIRYCAYNLNEGTTDISDLMQLRWSASSGSTTQDPVLAAKIDVSCMQKVIKTILKN